MDHSKLEQRVIELINESLPVQRLNKRIQINKLLECRDRYYLMECMIDNKKEKALFLRYDHWFFFIVGMHGLPEEPERREYKYIRRQPKQEYKSDPVKLAEKEKIEKEMLLKAEQALRELKRPVVSRSRS